MQSKFTIRNSFYWSAIGKFSYYLLSVIINLILARLLNPETFGVLGVLSIFIILSNLAVESGFRDALIRKKEVTDLEYSSVFYFNVFLSISIYIILFAFAPYIAKFYNNMEIILVSRWLFLTFILNAFSIVQTVILEKEMNFKKLSKLSVISTLLSGVTGVVAAYLGFEIWSLVLFAVLNPLFRAFLLWKNSPWKPIYNYEHSVITEMFSFSSKLLISGVFAHICANISQILIGKLYSLRSVGFYDRAINLVRVPMTSISDITNQVSYPLLASLEEEGKSTFIFLLKILSMITVPLFLFLIIAAEPIILLVLTEKWRPAIPLFQILCFQGILYPLTVLNSNILKIKGYSTLILKNEIIRNILILTTILIVYKYGVIALVIGVTTVNTFFPFKTFRDVDHLIFKGFLKNQTFLLVKFLIFAILAAAVSFLIGFLFDQLLLKLLIQLISGTIIYSTLLYIFERELLRTFLNIIQIKNLFSNVHS